MNLEKRKGLFTLADDKEKLKNCFKIYDRITDSKKNFWERMVRVAFQIEFD